MFVYKKFLFNINFITVILYLLLNFTKINSQLNNNNNNNNYLPRNPCSNIFQYRYNGNEWYGLLKIYLTQIPIIPKIIMTKIQKTINLPPIIHVKITLSQKGRLPPVSIKSNCSQPEKVKLK